MSIQIETVRTDAFSMRYFRFGRGEKTLVILPGLSIQSVMRAADAVAAAYQSLEERYTIYVFDRRAELPSPYPVRDMARDTAEAFAALGLWKVCLSVIPSPLTVLWAGSCTSTPLTSLNGWLAIRFPVSLL